jgi:hypothetical protein
MLGNRGAAMSTRKASARGLGCVPLAVSLTLALVTSAAAQFAPGGIQPGQFPPAGTTATPGMGAPAPAMGAAPGGAPPGQPPCFNDFIPLRQDAEKRAGAIQAAAKRKAPREEICKLFKNFAEAEIKVVKFVSTNQQWCGIPPQAIEQMKANHTKTVQTRDKICSGEGPAGMAGGPPRPSGPGLSEALGTSRLITPNTSAGRSGAFETLTGNALTR